MEPHRREPVPSDQSAHGDLEHGVGGLAVDRPVGDRFPQRHDAAAALAGMLRHRGLDRAEAGQAGGERVADGVVHPGGIDGAEVDQRAQDVRAAQVLVSLRVEAETVGRFVDDHAVEGDRSAPAEHDHVDRVGVGARYAVEVGGGAVRGNRPVADRRQCRGDALFGGVRRAVEAGDVRVDLFDRPRP